MCNWLWINLPVIQEDKYLEIFNSIMQSVISWEGLKLQACNLSWIYGFLILAIRLPTAFKNQWNGIVEWNAVMIWMTQIFDKYQSPLCRYKCYIHHAPTSTSKWFISSHCFLSVQIISLVIKNLWWLSNTCDCHMQYVC